MNTHAPDSFSALLAREELLDHARSTRRRGMLPDASAQHEEFNPLCGDRVKIYVRDADPISAVTYEADGCIISQAAASLIAEHARGKGVEEIAAMEREDMENLLGGSLLPARVKCGMLPLVALKTALGIG